MEAVLLMLVACALRAVQLIVRGSAVSEDELIVW
jgi:hypothetical protein